MANATLFWDLPQGNVIPVKKVVMTVNGAAYTLPAVTTHVLPVISGKTYEITLKAGVGMQNRRQLYGSAIAFQFTAP